MKTLLIKFIITCLLIGAFPMDTGGLMGQQKKEQTNPSRKKKPRKKQTTGQKKKKPKSTASKKKAPVKKKKKTAQSSQKNKKPTKKRAVKKRPSKQKAVKKSKTPKPPKVNVVELSQDFNSLTDQLQSSSQQLAHATSYLQPFDRKKIVKIENRSTKPVPIKDLEEQVFKHPDDTNSLRELGLRYESELRYEDAKDVYLRSIAREPLNADNHYFLGRLYQSNGELTRAQMAFEEALDIDPNHVATLNAISGISGKPDESSMKNELLNRSSDQEIDGLANRIKTAQDLIYDRDYEESLSFIDKALAEWPNQSNLYYLKGVSLAELGRTTEAKKAYQTSIHADPGNTDAHLALADHYYSQGKYIYAAMAFGDVVMLNPGDVESTYMQGLCYYNATEWKRCAQVWEKLLRIQSDHPLVNVLLPQTYYIIAVEYNRQGESSLGRAAFENAMNINPNTGKWLPGSYRALGKYYREKGMYKESLAAYQESVELRPNHSSTYLGLGITYWRMQEPLLAKAAWERSLELNPENNEAKGWLIVAQNN